MGKIKFLIKRIFNMNFKQMFEKIAAINKKTKKSKIYILFDMISCAFLYQAGYMDYYIFEMYNVPRKNRSTYLTRGINNRNIKMYNQKEYMHIFGNKDEFYKIYNEFIGRKYVDISTSDKEDVLSFIAKNELFIGKPRGGSCGKGIVKIHKNEFENEEAIYVYLKQNSIDLLEEYIVQHDEMNRISKDSVNTIRIISFLKDNCPKIVCAYFRIGNGKFVDNFNSGGMVVPVNVKNGKIEHMAIDKAGNIYENHPVTNTKIMGFEIPMWEECLELVKKAAVITPFVRLVGWDISVTNTGPVIVEANAFPGHDIYQLPVHTKDKIGMKQVFDDAINN